MFGSSRLVLAALPVVLMLAACSSDNASSTMTPSGPTTATTAPMAPPAASGSTMAEPSPTHLSSADVRSLLVNNTATGVARDGQTYYAWFSPSGQIRYEQGASRDTGTWRTLSNGSLCSLMARRKDKGEQCYSLYRSGNVLTFDQPDGTTVGSFSVLPGNPQAL